LEATPGTPNEEIVDVNARLAQSEGNMKKYNEQIEKERKLFKVLSQCLT
jgi:hypothetical protein